MREAVAAAVLTAALCCLQAAPARSDATAPRRSAAELMDVLMWSREPVGGPFALFDQTGRARTDADYRGKHLLVYFGFTSCPDICPTDLHEITQALILLGDDADKVQPLFITLDPERDGPARMAEYVAAFHPRLVGLRGDADAVRKAADAYKVFYEKVELPGGGYTVDHSAFIYLMDPEGRYLGFFPPGTTADRMLTIIRPHLAN
ncbi:photosynthetic protein synthase I [Methylopila jiangsuensis]|uniref:Photosynthetic protein synthase I n=1 Tax=Methylopila jiangsuensis TaxID=586230 RepID=A0A9W6JER3_9HYPH|nr:SCO family protein [Methylopila jiangsuensis]MDR6284237.1 protein SCO1/2 [Methylopila jiangsuensis]GLK76246.1 photosynthetic protein synthase I [Methylopila jiangsuensis]